MKNVLAKLKQERHRISNWRQIYIMHNIIYIAHKFADLLQL